MASRQVHVFDNSGLYPFKEVRIKQSNEPWITTELLHSKETRLMLVNLNTHI